MDTSPRTPWLPDKLFAAASTVRRRSLVSTTILVVLGIAVAVNTTMFSVVKALLSDPLPGSGSSRLYLVDIPRAMTDSDIPTAFTGAATFTAGEWLLTGDPDVEQVQGASVSPNFFEVLAASPIVGRGFLPASEYRREPPREVVISHRLWSERFGSSSLADKFVVAEGLVRHEVVGVMPPTFDYPPNTDIWAPAVRRIGAAGSDSFVLAVARLRRGASPSDAEQELRSMTSRLVPGHLPERVALMRPIVEELVGAAREPSWGLFFASSCVVVLACANVSGLLLVQAMSRRRDTAIRLALGASTRRLLVDELIYCSIVSLGSALVGFLLSAAAVRLFAVRVSNIIPWAERITVDWTAFGYTLLMAVPIAIALGVVPGLSQLRLSSVSTGDRTPGQIQGGHRRLNGLLITAQIAITVVLLSAAVTLIASYYTLLTSDPGFSTKNVWTASLRLPVGHFRRPPWQQLSQFFEDLQSKAREIPDVEAVGAVSGGPLSGHLTSATLVASDEMGNDIADGTAGSTVVPAVQISFIAGQYFEALDLPLLDGRSFDNTDRFNADAYQPQSKGPGTIILSRSTADRLWGQNRSLGKHVKIAGDPFVTARRIVGIVPDIKYSNLRENAAPQAYVPFSQSPGYRLTLYTKFRNERGLPAKLASSLRSVDSDLLVSDVKSLREVAEDSEAPLRLTMWLAVCFASLAIIQSVVGFYVLVRSSILEKSEALAVRLALGARPLHIVAAATTSSVVPYVVGLIGGIVVVLVVSPLLGRMIFGVLPSNPLLLAGVVTLMMVVGFVAILRPVRRALQTDPLRLLMRQG